MSDLFVRIFWLPRKYSYVSIKDEEVYMEYKFPKFEKIQNYDNSRFYKIKYLNKSRKLYKQQKYKESVIFLIKYLNSDILKNVSLKQPSIEVDIQHALAHIKLNIDDKKVHIRSNIIKINSHNKIVALRKVAEFNFDYFDFAKIVLQDDLLYIDFEIPLEQAYPKYLFYCLYEIIYGSDRIIAQLVFKYNIEPLYEIKRLSNKEEEKVVGYIQNVIDEYESIKQTFREDNKNYYQWDIGVISLYKLVFCTHIRGDLYYSIHKTLSVAYDRDMDIVKKIDAISNFFDKLKKHHNLEQEIYDVKLAITEREYSDSEIIEEFFKDHKEVIDDYKKNNKNFELSYFSVGVFLRFLYLYNVSKNYLNPINKLLIKCSNKDATKCSKHARKLFIKLSKADLDSQRVGFWVSIVVYIILRMYFYKG